VSDPNAKIFNIVDYGAVAYNAGAAGQNVAAFNGAINAAASVGGGTVLVPNGDWYFNSTIGGDFTSQSISVEGTGYAARLIFTGAGFGNGLYLNCDGVKVQGLRIIGTGASGLNGGNLAYVRNANSRYGGLVIRDVELEGTPDTRPANFLAVLNPMTSLVADVTVLSNSNESFGTQSTGIYVLGDQLCTDFSVRDCKVVGCNIGFAVTGGAAVGSQTIEGVSFTDCVTFGVQTGLQMTAGYLCPGHSWKGGHINANNLCVQLISYAQFKIADVLMYINQANPNAGGFVHLLNCTEIQVHNNHLVNTPENGPNAGGLIFGVAFDGSTDISLAAFNDMIGAASGSACIYNAGGNPSNRAFGNLKTGPGAVLAGSGLIDLGGNINV
jgi:hypothetical protein